MYCNPTVALDTDTAELRKIFRLPPKSDGKTFNTFTLFELIRKLEYKEIKTWAQLAIDLGVEPPALDKGQSAQKVQQYAVRLKRWMHAMHVDAFFEYLLNKHHVYWTQVPSINDPVSEYGRDGVVPEEDLALRALLPETRPKRGRRKAEDRDNDSDGAKSPAQRRRLDSPAYSEDFNMSRNSMLESATPASAHPGFGQNFDNRMTTPWSATPHPLDTFRWPQNDEAQTPMSAYPRSAITPSNRTEMWNDGSQSAITPNKTRTRRRHGPAVSSAWPSSGSSSTGKLRGRPPSNRSVTDGPFSTFPVNPANRDVPTISLHDNGSTTNTPTVGNSNVQHFFPPDMSTPQGGISSSTGQTGGRPSRLSLQVPQREGGEVRLATPPPIVLVNGQGNNSMQQDDMHQNPAMQTHQDASMQMDPLSNSSHMNPHTQLTTHFVSIEFRQTSSIPSDRTNVDALESHFISEILSADWYSSTGAPITRCSIDEASKICKQVIQNLQAESSSTEAFLINLSALAGGPLMTRLRMMRLDGQGRTDYECNWKMRFGSIEGEFTIKAAVQQDIPTTTQQDAINEIEDGEKSWKQRYLDLQQQIRERDKNVSQFKSGILDAFIASNNWGQA
ncbi:ARS binding protein 2-domain-containing protein [Bisporella sp. PMI_857]|nr:ARS binding protein 2-domain-containing protein [Bisporella sp. PMI_857]